MTARVTVYRPDTRLRSGLLAPLFGLVREVWARRWHIWISFKRDFAAAHAGTGLGQFWNYALPLVPIGAYALLTSMRAFPPIDHMPPLVFIGVGATLWFLFTGFITAPMAAVKAQHAMVAQTSFPLIGVVVSSLGRVLFETLVRFVVTLGLMLLLVRSAPLSGIFAIALLIAPLIFFSACGILFSMLNLIFPDIGRVVQIALTYLIFISDVIFPMPKNEVFATISMINPFSIFIDNIRHMLLFGAFSNAIAFWTATGVGLALLLVSARVFYVMEWRVRGHNL